MAKSLEKEFNRLRWHVVAALKITRLMHFETKESVLAQILGRFERCDVDIEKIETRQVVLTFAQFGKLCYALNSSMEDILRLAEFVQSDQMLPGNIASHQDSWEFALWRGIWDPTGTE